MKPPINREQALELLREYNSDPVDFNHFLESEAVMKALFLHLDKDKEYLGMLGLLHDIDWGITKENPAEHLTKAPEILKKAGFDHAFIETIISHGYGHEILNTQDKKRTEKIQHALAASETITGLIHAYALMRGTMQGMEAKGLKKKFKDKKFAAAINRDIIREIENVGISIDEFFSISIKAIQDIAPEVGLNN